LSLSFGFSSYHHFIWDFNWNLIGVGEETSMALSIDKVIMNPLTNFVVYYHHYYFLRWSWTNLTASFSSTQSRMAMDETFFIFLGLPSLSTLWYPTHSAICCLLEVMRGMSFCLAKASMSFLYLASWQSSARMMRWGSFQSMDLTTSFNPCLIPSWS